MSNGSPHLRLCQRPGRDPARGRSRSRFAQIPFNVGPGICSGDHFAMMEMLILVAALALRYRFRLAPDKPVTPRGGSPSSRAAGSGSSRSGDERRVRRTGRGLDRPIRPPVGTTVREAAIRSAREPSPRLRCHRGGHLLESIAGVWLAVHLKDHGGARGGLRDAIDVEILEDRDDQIVMVVDQL